jgi:hypothetical protein
MDKFWEKYITTRPVNSKGAFDEFVKMNQEPRNMADGGRIGFKQGTPQRLSLINNLKLAIAEAKKTNNYNLLKAARRETGGVLSEQTAKFLNMAANDKDYAKSFAKELDISTKEFNSLLDKRATAIQEYGRGASQKSSLKRVNPNKIKMINLINEGVNDTSLLAKKLKISKIKVSEIGNALYKDIYATSSAIGQGATRTTGTGVATFLPDNAKDLKSLLDKMHNVKGLETVEQRQIKKILGEAFGDGKNPELFKLYNNKINEYYDLKKKLAGTINLNLDHPLSSQMIKKLKLGKEAQLFVQPLTAEINQGTKSLLDKTYAQAFASKGSGREAKMKNIVNLAKKLQIPMGTTKLISEPFYKQDIPKKIIQAAETQNRVIKNIKNLPKEDIQKVFPDKRSKLISSNVKPINVKEVKKILQSFCGYGNSTGGRIGFKSGSCSPEVAQRNFLLATNDVAKGRVTGEAAEQIAKNAGKVVAKAGSKSALASILGPAGIGIDLAYEVGSIGFDMATDSNVSLKQALQNNWLTGAFIPGTGQEEYNKGLVKFDSRAEPIATIQNLIEKIESEEKNLERIKTSLVRGDYSGEAKKQILAKQEALIKNLYNDFDKVARRKNEGPRGENVRYLALEEGSPELVAFDQIKREYDSIGAARTSQGEDRSIDITSSIDQTMAPEKEISGKYTSKAKRPTLLKSKSNYGFEQMIKEGAQKRPVPFIDYSLIPEQYGKYNKNQLDEILKDYTYGPYVNPKTFGFSGYGDLSNYLSELESTHNIAQAGGVSKLAGGGMVGIRKPSVIPPESGPQSQGLASLKKYGSYY